MHDVTVTYYYECEPESEGIWLQCSCGWERYIAAEPTVEILAATKTEHLAEVGA